MGLVDKLKNKKLRQPQPQRKGPVWGGPEKEGITFSLLSRFLTCRERFRILVVEGLKPVERWNHRLGYGNMWHVCEEAFASEVRHFDGELNGVDTTLWSDNLQEYCKKLCQQYPVDQNDIDKWYNVCKVQFPIYAKHWREHPDVVERTPLLQEQVFDVPYKLPSGRTVRLRGKWDSVDLIGKGKGAGIFLQENKTKGDIEPEQMRRQLTFDLQTQLYLVALRSAIELHRQGNDVGLPEEMCIYRPDHVHGVRYNVVRRPLSGGRGTIKQHAPTKSRPMGESKEDYYDRLRGIIDGSSEDAPGPDYFFMRWKTEISKADVDLFRKRCLDPILEQLCNWWEWINSIQGLADELWPTKANHGIHWQHPFGCVNTIDEYGHTDLDEYIRSGSEVGLARTQNLFPEL